jgi:CHAD domain-containing protein
MVLGEIMAGKMDGSVCAFGAAYMLNQLKNLQNEVQGVQAAMDIECVHRMRVASRRLRSAQEYFDSFLPKKNSTIWEKQIQSITTALGKARDLDIQIEAIQEYKLQHNDIRLQPGFKRLILRLSQKRKQAQLSVLMSVSKFSSNPVIKRVQKELLHYVEPDGNEEFISMPLRLLANQAINEKLTNFLSYEPFVHIPEKKLELHAMRIAAKHLRYTMEIFAPLFPGELTDWLQPVRQAQEQLGVIHDCDIWIDFLPQFLDSEHELSQNYYGHSREHYRIIPGVLHFQQNRQEIRNLTYQQFVLFWDASQKNLLWQTLLDHLSENHPVEMVRTMQIQRNVSI